MVYALTGLCRGIVTIRPVGHDDVLALPRNLETNFLERPNRVEVIDTRYTRHRLCNLDLAYVGVLEQLIANREVLSDGVNGVLDRLGFRNALRPAPRQTRH